MTNCVAHAGTMGAEADQMENAAVVSLGKETMNPAESKSDPLPTASSCTLQTTCAPANMDAHTVVETISVEELRYMQEERIINAPVIHIPFLEIADPTGATTLFKPVSDPLAQSRYVCSTRASLLHTAHTTMSPLHVSIPKDVFGNKFDDTSWLVNDTSSATLRVSLHFSFLPSVRSLHSPAIFAMPSHDFHGVDIMRAFLHRAIAADASFEQHYSTDPHCYKLYIADEITGEPEMAVQLDHSVHNFTCYFVEPLLAAQLRLFPQRSTLLPAPADNIMLRVQVRSREIPNKSVSRVCVIPLDLVIESLESVVSGQLPACEITHGSLRVVHGPLELSIHERYNFGMGCGEMYCPISQLTMIALYRFGVTEVVVTGCTADDTNTGLSSGSMRTSEDIVIEMKLEEAMAFQQFEVISTNRYGAQQQRLLCVDGEHLYTVRPNITDTLPQTTERMIADIEDVRCFANKPLYMEIEYAPSSGFEVDRFECTTAYNRALLDEKLHIIRRELRKRAEKSAAQAHETVFARFFQGMYNKLRFIRQS